MEKFAIDPYSTKLAKSRGVEILIEVDNYITLIISMRYKKIVYSSRMIIIQLLDSRCVLEKLEIKSNNGLYKIIKFDTKYK